MLGSQAARPRTDHRARQGRAQPPDREALLGLEHEFIVRDEAGPVDFRGLIHRLGVPGRRVDPYDRNAYRCGWGGTITTDDREAEVAIAPVNQVGGFTGVVDARARIARAALEAVLPTGMRLEGYSTHLSVSTPPRLADATARLVARAFAPSLILMTDRAHSPGLLVMPRPGRTELGVEYVDGARLRAASALAVGSALAATGAVGAVGRHTRARVSVGSLAAIEVDVREAVRRFGWYVDRGAFGADLLVGGRATLLRRVGGGTITAGEHLEAAWTVARTALEGIAAPADLRDADDFVAGRLPLPIEDPAWRERPEDASAEVDGAPGSPFGRLVHPRARAGFAVEAVVVTWDFAVFALIGRGGRRTGYASVPRADLAGFLDDLDRGELDSGILAFLAGPARGRFLAGWAAAHAMGYHDSVAPLAAFAPPERDPLGEPWTFDLSASPPVPAPSVAVAGLSGGLAAPATSDVSTTAQPKLGKVPEHPIAVIPSMPAGRRIPWLPLGVIVGVVIALLVVGSAIGLIGGGGKTTPSPSPSSPGVASPSLSVVIPSVPVATCTGPSIELVEHFYPDVAHTGGATTPAFTTPPGAKFCLIELDTYHWNEGAGAPAGGTLSLLDSAGKRLGTWPAIASAGQGGVLAGWTSSVPTTTPIILDGSYTVEDSDPATLSWSQASGGAGFLRVWAQLYAVPGAVYSAMPSPSPSTVRSTDKLILTGMIDSDSPTLDKCGSGQNDHNVYSFGMLAVVGGSASPAPSVWAPMIGRKAVLTLAGPPDAGTYHAVVDWYHGFVQIRVDGRKCPTTTARSTFVSLTIEGIALEPAAGAGFIADFPTP